MVNSGVYKFLTHSVVLARTGPREFMKNTSKKSCLQVGNSAVHNVTMTPEEAFLLLKSFFTERKASRFALGKLREKVEIGIVIGDYVECALFRHGTEVMVEKRAAVKPDFIFKLEPQTVTILAHQTRDDIGEIGLAIITEMLSGSVQVEMPGGLMCALRNGYVDIIFSGGAPVSKMLVQIGLSSPAKFVDLFRKIRR